VGRIAANDAAQTNHGVIFACLGEFFGDKWKFKRAGRPSDSDSVFVSTMPPQGV
jgi:hypothetical protein